MTLDTELELRSANLILSLARNYIFTQTILPHHPNSGYTLLPIGYDTDTDSGIKNSEIDLEKGKHISLSYNLSKLKSLLANADDTQEICDSCKPEILNISAKLDEQQGLNERLELQVRDGSRIVSSYPCIFIFPVLFPL